MQNGTAIQLLGLQKRYGVLTAVQSLDFSVQRGEIFSLLGPNGAGKSTTIAMLSCLLSPTGGDARLMGHSIQSDPRAVKSMIGVVPQEIAMYEDLSGRQNLLFWGRMVGLRGDRLKRRIDETLDLVELTDRQHDCAGHYSGGMQRRLNIAIALLHEPQIVILDEPTVGIDPQSRRKILDGVKELNRRGVTILYTTHYMEEAQELSHRIAILDHGRLIAQGTHAELVKMVGGQSRIRLTLSRKPAGLLAMWRTLPGVHSVSEENGAASLLVKDSTLVLPTLFESAARANVQVNAMELQEPDLEAVFLHLTGKALRD
ncbi:MAG: ATP-binding cassette domain-containing protein [Anaerolineaceae bacterium]|nr:ATP-binding cassette domain-containing protein [Anaerolineaceae bacterium]MBN2677290.1 ATP-binding cassette domain-containing protein [Anaerolineaceae bacterium]